MTPAELERERMALRAEQVELLAADTALHAETQRLLGGASADALPRPLQGPPGSHGAPSLVSEQAPCAARGGRDPDLRFCRVRVTPDQAARTRRLDTSRRSIGRLIPRPGAHPRPPLRPRLPQRPHVQAVAAARRETRAHRPRARGAGRRGLLLGAERPNALSTNCCFGATGHTFRVR
jgi:hypothetical protein